MYFPYLRGKQEEILAVRDAGFLSELTVPIFEPTSISDRNLKRWHRAIQAGRRFAIITNSDNGSPGPPPSEDEVHGSIDNLPPEGVFPALEIRPNTTTGLIRSFADRFRGRTCVVVHRNHLYTMSQLARHLDPLADLVVHALVDGRVPREVLRGLPAQGKVLLRDGFEAKARNAEYPPRSYFDDLLYTFADEGFGGFGDFTIVGDRFRKGGGPANAIALHLTEITPTTVLTHHFVSSPPHVRTAPQDKYFSALRRLLEHTENEPQFDTVGVNAFRGAGDYPGLGKPKRWSILHHLEIIDRALSAERRNAFL